MITASRSSVLSGPMRETGGRISHSTMADEFPFSSRQDTSASPTPSSVITVAASNAGLAHKGFSGRLHGLLVARRKCAQRMLHTIAQLASTLSGMSKGFCVTNRCRHLLIESTEPPVRFFNKADGASLNNKCASSKKRPASAYPDHQLPATAQRFRRQPTKA